jgi:hypothetical protein
MHPSQNMLTANNMPKPTLQILDQNNILPHNEFLIETTPHRPHVDAGETSGLWPVRRSRPP